MWRRQSAGYVDENVWIDVFDVVVGDDVFYVVVGG